MRILLINYGHGHGICLSDAAVSILHLIRAATRSFRICSCSVGSGWLKNFQIALHMLVPLSDFSRGTTGLGERVVPRLRELAPTDIGSQEEGFTQPRDHSLAEPCISQRTSHFGGLWRDIVSLDTSNPLLLLGARKKVGHMSCQCQRLILSGLPSAFRL